MKYDLAEPLKGRREDGSEVVLLDHLVFRLPQAADLIATKGRDGADGVVATVARLTGQPEAMISRLGLIDFNACDDILTGFFAGPQKAGAARAAEFLKKAGIPSPGTSAAVGAPSP